jgi:hypothetical protein
VGGKTDDVFGIIGSKGGMLGIRILQSLAELGTILAVSGNGFVQFEVADVPHLTFRVSAMRPYCTEHQCTAYNREGAFADYHRTYAIDSSFGFRMNR